VTVPEATFTDMVPPPREGRVFRQAVLPGLADCSPSGRIRLDALARWLQDLAYADVVQAGVADRAVWVVRRARMRVRRFPRFGEEFKLGTFCSGLGRMWAERRSMIAREGSAEPDVEAVSLWVHLDPVARRPTPLSPEEIAVYGDLAASRKVTARLRHPAPNGQCGTGAPWIFRATECDLAGHINNSAYWQPLEEELLLSGAEPERIDVEMEFRAPAQPGQKLVLSHGDYRWIVDEAGETHASLLLRFVDG
jgi:acyl-ACP thioesterase